jgi:2-phosphosulfolactate phosphatase
MNVDVVFAPRGLSNRTLNDRIAVVIDVLRATTTIAAALHAGAAEIHVHESLDDARSAHASQAGTKILAGETRCLPPEGFDLGNSPGHFTKDRCAGATIFLATTNGTRALLASRTAASLYAAALVNATATAKKLASSDRDLTLVCAGTDGTVALEDVIGAGALLSNLIAARSGVNVQSTRGYLALESHREAQGHGFAACFRHTRGGQNIIAASLHEDIDFAARLDACPVVAACDVQNLIIRAAT